MLTLIGAGITTLLGLAILLIAFCFAGSAKPTFDAEDAPEIRIPNQTKGPSQALIVLSKEDQAKVDGMTARAVAWLKKTQTPEGTWPGHPPIAYAAMGGLTLLECKTSAQDPAVEKSAAFVRKRLNFVSDTYTLAMCILFLDKLNNSKDKEAIGRLAMRLIAGQNSGGGWTYNCQPLDDKACAELQAMLTEVGREALTNPNQRLQNRPLALRSLPVFQKDRVKKNQGAFRSEGDNSNTQFALLALWAARRHHFPVDRSLDFVVKRFRETQNENGSWSYAANQNVSPRGKPTMTCAGLLGLAVGYGIAPEGNPSGPGPKHDPAIKKALDHLGQAVGQPQKKKLNPNSPPESELYFLWSLERVAVLYQLRQIAGKDWYHWGMNILESYQRSDDYWHFGIDHGHSPLVDTCFALLFLQRVNLAKDLTDKLEELFGQPALAPPPEQGRKD